MKFYLLFISILFTGKGFSQSRLDKVVIKIKPNGSFLFINKWAYPWYINKDDETGKFESSMGDINEKEDTVHLYYTADCTTNVQGPYKIRYCDAVQYKNELTLTFSDGMPAYASNFYVKVKDGKFSFQPELIYPGSQSVAKKYEVIKQELILDKSTYEFGDKAKGYINIAFKLKGKNAPKETYYIRGFFKTPVLKKNTSK